MLAFLDEWWRPMLDDPARLQRPDYQVYAVLTMCRALYTLQCGGVVSKPIAATWAQEALDEHWVPLITCALAWRSGDRFDNLDAVVNFLRYALEHSAQTSTSDACH